MRMAREKGVSVPRPGAVGAGCANKADAFRYSVHLRLTRPQLTVPPGRDVSSRGWLCTIMRPVGVFRV